MIADATLPCAAWPSLLVGLANLAPGEASQARTPLIGVHTTVHLGANRQRDRPHKPSPLMSPSSPLRC
jgi:hypothetical protein